ncbi:MAG: D-alanyl-D-alanine carboxypeptidase/D-alanyl-D-alanine-endopeptidase [Saprospiraceae bacterium]|nr:D-alanyl-D-alanine carboxypeptidase/D-alanyl-D-alanine-endopeptidase [Saprospiraceae bacterium]
MCHRILLGCLFILVQITVSGQSDMARATDAFQSNPISQGATLAFSVRKVKVDQELFQRNGDKWMIPASNQKLITTAAAWELLGPSHRIPTLFRLEGFVVDSLFIGNIILEGHGDPSLASSQFGPSTTEDSIVSRWAKQIRELGIRNIRGQVICQPALFAGSPVGLTWEWGDLGGCFATGVWPLNWQENCIRTQLDKDSLGYYLSSDSLVLPWPVVTTLEPARPFAEPDFVTGAPGDLTRWVSGPERMTIPIALRLAIPNVPRYLSVRLPRLFRQSGIPFQLETVTTTKAQSIWQDTLWSPSLRKLITHTNTESQNMYAEAILRRLGEVRGTNPSLGQGLDQVRQWLDKNKIKPAPYLHDASGLSRQNAVTASFLTLLLSHCAQDSLPYAGFGETLAVGGKSGTLFPHLRDKRIKGKVFAKTGTLNRTRSLSGYLVRQDGEQVTFSILANQFTGTTREFMALAQQWLIQLSLSKD